MPGTMEYDARWKDTFILSHLDGDIARLVRLRQALDHTEVPFEVLCFPWQSIFLHEYLGDRVRLREIDMHALEAELGVGISESDDARQLRGQSGEHS